MRGVYMRLGLKIGSKIKMSIDGVISEEVVTKYSQRFFVIGGYMLYPCGASLSYDAKVVESDFNTETDQIYLAVNYEKAFEILADKLQNGKDYDIESIKLHCATMNGYVDEE